MTLVQPFTEQFSALQPSRECEIFVYRIPLTVCEQELTSMFEKYGDIYKIRLVQRDNKRYNYAFVRFTDKTAVKVAILQWNGYEIRKRERISVCKSIDNRKLILFNVPKYLRSFEIMKIISMYTTGLADVHAPAPRDKKSVNTGLAILMYDTHICALVAKKILTLNKSFPKCKKPLYVEWHTPGLSREDFEFSSGNSMEVPFGCFPVIVTRAECNLWTTFGYCDLYNYYPESVTVKNHSEIYAGYGRITDLTMDFQGQMNGFRDYH